MNDINESTQPPPFPDDLIKPTAAAKLLNKHLGTLYRWMDDGTLPYWIVGKRLRRVSKADVLAMVRPAKPKHAAFRPISLHERKVQNARTARILEEMGVAKYLPK